MDIKPNHTIYINNINEKVKKEELKRSLHTIFTQFGEIVAIMSFKTMKMRGQAHIIFKEISSATNALRALQGFPFYDKPMRIQFSREDSDLISKAKGTYVERANKLAGKVTKQKKPAKPVKGKTGVPGVSSMEGGSSDPHNILFCSNLPDDTDTETRTMLFQSFPGMKDVRMIPNRTGIAFVEFESEAEAAPAIQALNNFKITPTQQMKVDYAKK